MGFVLILLSIIVVFASWFILHRLSQLRVLKIWKDLGVAHQPPSLLFGNNRDVIKGKMSQHEFQLNMYRYFKGERIAVVLEGKRPVILILDPNIIKSILVGNFDHFIDRPGFIFREKSYVKRMLISLRGEQWKKTRQSMTPAFTIHKLKDMFETIVDCARHMVNYIDKQLPDSNGPRELEMKRLLGRFTLEVISSCAFGLNISDMNDEQRESSTDTFFQMATEFQKNTFLDKIIIHLVLMVAPSFASAIPASFVNRKALAYLREVCLGVKKSREENPLLRRKDIFQMLLDKHDTPNENGEVMDEDTMIAQSLLFILAGYETSSTVLALACYQLALNPAFQDKARQEVEDNFENSSELSFQDVQQLHYVEQVILETLRLHPPMSRVDRICTKSFELKGSPVVIQPGMRVRIPIFGLHMDPDFFPDPEVFDPERFSPEFKNTMNPYTYLPFGKGQRHCIGNTFAMMTTKICMAYLLKNYRFSTCDRTDIPFRYDTRSILLKAADGIWLSVEKLN